MPYGFDLTKLSQLTIENLSNNGPAVLDEARPSYEYTKDNKRTDKINGLAVVVVFPANRYEKLKVTVADPVDRVSAVLNKAPSGTPVLVTFENFTAKIYRDRTGNYAVSAKADSVQIVDDTLVID